MEILEQGTLKLKGAECFGTIADASLHQGLGNHGVLMADVWLLPGAECRKDSSEWKDMPVALVPAGEDREPVFSGLVKYAGFRNINGRPAVQIKAYSYTVLLEGEERDRSFQRESRTYGELVRSILEPYRAAYIWSGEGRDEAIGRFLMQYGENDWEFLRRVASFHGHAVIPEVRFPGAKMFIGLPAGRKERALEAGCYHIKKNLDKTCRNMDNKTTGGLSEGLEIEVQDRYEDYAIGDIVRFLDRQLITAGKHSRLKGSQWVHDYCFRPAGNCRMERMDNLKLAGAAVRGSVLGTTPESSRLSLVTDHEGGQSESWHIQPVYYAGGGKGYSGQPEKGDTQYLYFPTGREEDRYIIGGADAGAERIASIVEKAEAEDSIEMAAEDSRTAPAGGGGSGSGSRPASSGGGISSAASGGASSGAAGVSAPAGGGSQPGGSVPAGGSPPVESAGAGNSGGAGAGEPSKTKNWSTPGGQSLVLNESGVRLSKGSRTRINIMENGIRVTGKGDMVLSAEDIFWEGQNISMEAKGYIWLKSQDSSILLLPDAVHMKAVDVYIKSPESTPRPILTEEDAAIVLGMYEEMKKSVPPVYAADGSIIRPDGYDDILYSDEMIDYFEKYVYGKGEYENRMGQPFLTLYDRWLEETYGKAELKKFWEHLGTIDGIQGMLDVAGIFLEPADLLNAAISLCRGRWGDAALSAACAIPLLGDWLGKGVKKGISAGTEAALKAGKAGKEVMNRLEITYKALSGKAADLRKYLDDAVEMMLNTNRYGPGYRLCLEGVGCYLDDGAELVFKIVDDAGDSVSYIKRVGDVAEDLTKTALKHPLNRHMPSKVANQFKHMSKEAIQKYLEEVTFFNKAWTEGQITDALNYGYKEALSKGINTGEYSFRYLGDNITVYLEDGIFKLGYGGHSYTYEEIMALLGG